MLREHLVGRFPSFVTSSMTTAICEHLSLGDLPREVREMASNPWIAKLST